MKQMNISDRRIFVDSNLRIENTNLKQALAVAENQISMLRDQLMQRGVRDIGELPSNPHINISENSALNRKKIG